MRIVLALLMCCGVAFAQDTTKYFKSVDYGWNWQRGKFRGGLILPTDTTNNKLGIAQIDANCYAWSGTKWSKINSSDTTFLVRYYRKNQVDSAILANTPAEFDTTSLSNRIDTKLNITDTTNKWVASITSLNDSTIRVIKGTTTTDITIKSSATVTNATRLVTTVYNNSGSTITKGSVVYINGAHSSNLPSIALARANLESTSAYTYGLVENDITNNNSGTVIQNGFITNLNLPTSTYTAGQTLYLSPTVAGGYTLTKPLAPNHYVAIGTITRAHPTFGTIQIAIRNGFQLDEMSDVSISVVPLDSTLLQFSRTDSLWHDVSVFNAIGNKYLKPTDTASLSTRINSKGSGTVTSIALGRGITGTSPITTTGTIGLDTTLNYTFTGNNIFSGRTYHSGNTGFGIAYPQNIFSASGLQYSTGTASQSTNVITGVGTTFTSAMVGSQFIFANGTSAGYITAFVSTTSLQVSVSQTVTSQAFTINYQGLRGNNNNFAIGSPPAGNTGPFLKIGGFNVTNLFSITGGNLWSTLVSGYDAATNTDGDGSIASYTNSSNSATSGALRFIRANSSGAVSSGWQLGEISTYGSYTTTPTFTDRSSAIRFYASQTHSSTAAGTFMTFATTPNSTVTLTEAMRIQNSQNVCIGTTLDATSAILNVVSTTKGVLFPRMTTTQKNAISTPVEGMIIYDLTLHKLSVYTGSVWETITSL